MIWTISWRNIWRNKKRSGVLLAAIASGLWAGLLTVGMFNGMTEQMVRTAINTRTSHVQLHAPGFVEHPDVVSTIPNGSAVLARVRAAEHVARASGRSVVPGMGSSATTGMAVVLRGIDVEAESGVTDVHKQMVEGAYFGSGTRNECVLGQKLAEKLSLGVGDKIIITAQAPDGSITGGAFRIVGLYRTVTTQFDQTMVFGHAADVDRTFDLNGAIHEIALMADDLKEVPTLTKQLAADFPSLDVRSWDQLEPEMGMMTSMSQQMNAVIMVIIMLALVFGITNTMLMGVLERIRELGVLMALGMKPRLVFSMIVVESIALSALGWAIGMTAGAVSIGLLSRTGINLSIVAAGLESFGMASRLYPSLAPAQYVMVAALVVATAMAGSLYPGVKAARLHPMEALRTY
jgi:putative ABC transport system permease protein